jgi:putative hydrolase of the HAD superfamily
MTDQRPSTYIFDYGNVISIVEPKIFWQTAIPFAVGSLTNEQRLAHARELLVQYETGEMETEEFIPVFMERTGLDMPRERFIRAWSEFFIPIQYTRRLIRTLKQTSRVALLSNTNPLHFEGVIKPTDVYPLFDAVSLSYEVGAMKPDRKPFEDILAKLQCSPEECIYFDDLPDNVQTAREMGMTVIHVQSESQLQAEVEALLPWLGNI